MKKLIVVCVFLLSAGALFVQSQSIFAPGVVLIWRDGTGTPMPGISVKNYTVGEGSALSLTSFELKAAFDPDAESFRFDAGVRVSFPFFPRTGEEE